MIPFKINVTCAQQDRIANSEVHSTMYAIVPLRLMLLSMPKGCFCVLYILDYISHILLSTFVWMHTPQHIYYCPNILLIN